VDTLWTRGHSTLAGTIAGAVILGALGAVAGTSLGEENAGSAQTVLGGAGLGALVGGVLGALIGSATPRWQRRFP
jgi:cyanophycinase-like exopeptidase